ncbi:hypothetical protein BsWGS_08545 [Bradybaena similaris]
MGQSGRANGTQRTVHKGGGGGFEKRPPCQQNDRKWCEVRRRKNEHTERKEADCKQPSYHWDNQHTHSEMALGEGEEQIWECPDCIDTTPDNS